MKGPIQQQFERTLELLREKKAKFALAGGYASSLYRSQERFTKDIDFIIYTEGNVIQDSRDILEELGLIVEEIREAQLKGGPPQRIKNKSTPVMIVCGLPRAKQDVPVDFLLHTFPWMLNALERAQQNQLDIGFGWKIPILTAEDILLAKFNALGHSSSRIDDISDIKEIFAHTEIDLPYLVGRMKAYKLECPKVAEKFVPDIVRKISKEIRSSLRSDE